MTQAKHSPAPWKNGADANGKAVIFQDERVTGPERNEEYQANRALIDSSPDMLEALEALSSQVRDAVGVINEFIAMPVESLRVKFPTTVARLNARLEKAAKAIAKATTTHGES